MAFDDNRNRLYAQAIEAAVTPESVVLDLGAGIGVLGLIAAAAGAKRVYLVEPEPIVNVSMEIARANNLADKIVILQGKIEDVELPEKVDIIISVFTGNLLFSEDLLPSLFYARDHYLKPGGKLIPDQAQLLLSPISAPTVYHKHIGRWSESNLGQDYSPGRRFAANEIIWLDRKNLQFQRLSQAHTIACVDLVTTTHGHCNGNALVTIDKTGLCHGLLCSIKIKLGDQWLDTDPDSADVHWSPVILPFDPPLELKEGKQLNMTLTRPCYGDWTWVAKTDSSSHRHSTFLARIDGQKYLRRIAQNHRPGLSQRGSHTLVALKLIAEGRSIGEIIAALTTSATPLDEDRARQLVHSLALKFGKE